MARKGEDIALAAWAQIERGFRRRMRRSGTSENIEVILQKGREEKA